MEHQIFCFSVNAGHHKVGSAAAIRPESVDCKIRPKISKSFVYVGGDCGVSRDCAPVVREPGHHGVVDTPLAQRGSVEPICSYKFI